MKPISGLIVLLLIAGPAWGEEVKAAHAKVVYTGIDADQAESLAKVLSAARKVYAKEFGLDMPETVVLSVTCARGEAVRLYNDGQDRLFLSVPSKKKLAKPAESGVYNLYGLCHELGHIGMYRALKNRGWMTTAAAEGWASYAGSIVVDEVFTAEGEKLWLDPYDYSQDGTARLEKAQASDSPSEVSRGAAQWGKLEKLVERGGFAKLFAAWEATEVDPADPDPALAGELKKLWPDRKADLTKWWKEASPLFVEKRESSEFETAKISPSKLSGRPLKLAFDDDSSDGKKSIAGGGHARKFSAPAGGTWYVCAVSLHGARYGSAKASDATFEVTLCDEEMKPIAVWKKPLEVFKRGEPTWVRLEVPPTQVPKEFYICYNFRPTATNGVFVDFDASTNGSSVVATPGKKGSSFSAGDWMIRVELDQAKEADPLKSVEDSGQAEKKRR